jgi:NAD(P)-dependent dehydrogenase (short-subunit alcohol dehydrogenase family)
MSAANRTGVGRLEGKNAVITGGTRGIGLAVARRFCEEGASVVIAGRDMSIGERALHGLLKQGHEAIYVRTDVTRQSDVDELMSQAVDYTGSLDILVNNAGVLYGAGVHKITAVDWDKVLGVNVKGATFCIKAAAGYMARAGGGSIINTSSIAARAGTPGQVAYAASKAALESVTRSAASELAINNIRVNAVAPGLIETRMTAGLEVMPRGRIVSRTLLDRTATPEDIAGVYAFLASDDSAFMTGQVLAADGGRGLDI